MNNSELVLIPTSGTSSQKWVALSKRALQTSAESVNKFLEVTEKDIWFQSLPLSHVGGLSIQIRADLSCSKVVPWHNPKLKWDVRDFYRALVDSGATLISMVPTQVFDLVRGNFKCPAHLRAAIIGGAALSETLYLGGRNLGWPLLPSFGMTEFASQIATAPLSSLEENKFPNLQILSHIQARTDGGQVLYLKSEAMFSYYLEKRVEGDIKVSPILEEGWFKTEDRAELNEKVLRPLGRVGDRFKISGEMVSLVQLEGIFQNILLTLSKEYDLLPDAVILPCVDERTGYSIELFIVLSERSPEIAQKIRSLFANQVKPFEKIRKINFVSEIQRTELGKPMKHQNTLHSH